MLQEQAGCSRCHRAAMERIIEACSKNDSLTFYTGIVSYASALLLQIGELRACKIRRLTLLLHVTVSQDRTQANQAEIGLRLLEMG